jgi:D-3-phosphoglycerate dehydrogenase / 2-oxoglutarate reductase
MENVLITTSSFGKYDDSVIKKIEENGLNIILNPFGRTLTEGEVKDLISEFNPVGMIAGVEPLNAKVFDQANSLKIISRCGIGLSSVDLEAAKEKGIEVFNTPDAPTMAVAELTVALIFDLIRRLSEADRNIRKGNWKKLMGRLLSDMTVGLLGCGRIGKKVAEYLSIFGCEVVGYDPSVSKIEGVTMVSLEDLCRRSDIISIHVPLTEDTRNMVDKKFFGQMKDGSFIINASRGEVVDEDELISALKSEKLAGAALDTFKEEPYAGPLAEMENVVLSAHMGSYAKEARIRMEAQAVDNLLNNMRG